MKITEFLEARIAEDEAVAREATEGPWEWEPETDIWGDCGPNLVTVAKLPPYADGSQSPVESVIGSWGHDANGISVSAADAAHIVRNDPARVLAECAAKRAIIGLYASYGLSREPGASAAWSALGGALEDLAAVYSEHSDYDNEWAAK